jgi:hypothetical protein
MYTALGLLLLVIGCAAIAYGLVNQRWRGKEHGGYEVQAATNKGSLLSLHVGVRTRTALDFELRHEGWFDRAAKAIGLSVEGQLGTRRIDDALYLLADEPRVIAALRADRELADALFALFSKAWPQVKKVQRVTCRDGVLRAQFATKAASGEADRIAADVAPELIALGARLAADHPGTPANDRLRPRALVLFAAASALAAHGLLEGLHLAVSFVPDTLDDRALWAFALPASALVLFALAAATVLLLGRTSRAHGVLLGVLLIAVLGVPLGALGQVRDLNMEADTSPAETHVVQVTDKHIVRGSKGSHSYYVTFGAWPGRTDGHEIQVTHGDYDRYYLGQEVTVVLRRGYLGIPWLESAEPTYVRTP